LVALVQCYCVITVHTYVALLMCVTICPGIAMFAYVCGEMMRSARDVTNHCGTGTKAKNKLC